MMGSGACAGDGDLDAASATTDAEDACERGTRTDWASGRRPTEHTSGEGCYAAANTLANAALLLVRAE